MEVKLLTHTNLGIAIAAIRNCYDSFHNSDTICDDYSDNKSYRILSEYDNLGTKDKELLSKILENKHTSTLEHLNYTFALIGVPRSVLQELVRHRIASYSVKSSRYTLCKELKNENPFTISDNTVLMRAKKYLYFDEPKGFDSFYNMYRELIFTQIKQLELLRNFIVTNNITKSDKVKLLLPESWKTNIVMTINARSLRNLFKLRSNSQAYKLIQDLVHLMYRELPDSHTILYKDCFTKGENK